MKTTVTAIIHLPKKGAHAGARCGKFLRSKEHGDLHIWEGRALSVEEFNREFPKAVRAMAHMQTEILAQIFVTEVEEAAPVGGGPLAVSGVETLPAVPEGAKVPIEPEAETVERTDGENGVADGPDTSQKVDESGAPSFGVVSSSEPPADAAPALEPSAGIEVLEAGSPAAEAPEGGWPAAAEPVAKLEEAPAPAAEKPKSKPHKKKHH